MKGQAVDVFTGDGENLYTPGGTGEFLSENRNVIHGPFQTLGIRGWFGVDGVAISEFGYAIGDNEPIFDESFMVEPEGAVKAAGGEYAMRFIINMDVSAIGDEEVLVMPVAKMEDGTVVAATYLNVKYTAKAAGTHRCSEG